jgi:hypothetical protein
MPSRAGIILAWIIVALTIAAVWKFVDYRNQRPKLIQWVIWAR